MMESGQLLSSWILLVFNQFVCVSYWCCMMCEHRALQIFRPRFKAESLSDIWWSPRSRRWVSRGLELLEQVCVSHRVCLVCNWWSLMKVCVILQCRQAVGWSLSYSSVSEIVFVKEQHSRRWYINRRDVWTHGSWRRESDVCGCVRVWAADAGDAGQAGADGWGVYLSFPGVVWCFVSLCSDITLLMDWPMFSDCDDFPQTQEQSAQNESDEDVDDEMMKVDTYLMLTVKLRRNEFVFSCVSLLMK